MMLVPAGILILVLFAAIAVDSAGAYLAQRQLTDALSAAANDAVTAGLANGAFYADGAVVVDPARAAQVVCTDLGEQGDGDLHDVRVTMGVSGAAVTVRGTAVVDAAFGRLIPHFSTRQVTAQASAVARQAAGGPPPQIPAPLEPLSC